MFYSIPMTFTVSNENNLSLDFHSKHLSHFCHSPGSLKWGDIHIFALFFESKSRSTNFGLVFGFNIQKLPCLIYEMCLIGWMTHWVSWKLNARVSFCIARTVSHHILFLSFRFWEYMRNESTKEKKSSNWLWIVLIFTAWLVFDPSELKQIVKCHPKLNFGIWSRSWFEELKCQTFDRFYVNFTQLLININSENWFLLTLRLRQKGMQSRVSEYATTEK